MRLLKKLSEAMGVSGAEHEVRDLILDELEGHADDIRVDTMGNIIALKRGTGRQGMRVMLAAHMDEVGLMVTGYDGNGALKVQSIGGLDPRILLGKRLLVGDKKLPGVTGARPVHLLGAQRDVVIQIDALRVDIGAKSKDAARGKAPVGTRIGFDTQFKNLGSIARGKAFDDRVGCAVLLKLMQGSPFAFDVYAAFTVQEEVGVRGAAVAAHRIDPQAAFVLEGTIADGIPDGEEADSVTQFGKGAALSVMDRRTLYDRRLNNFLLETARLNNLPVQLKRPGIGGTDAGSIHIARAGVPTVAVSVPCRYIHSPAALLNKRDYKNTEKLMRETLLRLSPRTLRRN